MSIDIKELSEKDLQQKIENIKAEREKTANALKRYEEELERRKQEVHLGVPFSGTLNEMPPEAFSRGFLEWFPSEASADKFADYFYNFVEALQKLDKGEPIDINVLLPLLPKGQVLYSPYDEKWKWVEPEAIAFAEEHGWYIKNSQVIPIEGFNIKPAEDWETSLMECGL